MEEDIKILEELKDAQERCIEHTPDSPFTMLWKKQNQALENLIKGYKLEKLKNVLDEQSLKEALEDYIPKSKIQEKIEEYKQEIKEIRAKEEGLIWNYRLHKLDYAIRVLQELLKEE